LITHNPVLLALAGVLFCGGFLPFTAAAPNLADGGLMLLLGFFGIARHFCLIRAFAAAPANIDVRLYGATLGDFVQPHDFRGNSRPAKLVWSGPDSFSCADEKYHPWRIRCVQKVM
jgi:hypothetical protein